MKKNSIFLVMLAVLLAFSMAFAGCPADDGGDKDKDKDKDKQGDAGGGGAAVILPVALTPTDGVGYFEPVTGTPADGLRFNTSGNYSFVYIGRNSTAAYDVISVEGNKIVVKKDAADGVDTILCTNFQGGGSGALTLIGSEGDFAAYANNPMMPK